MADEFFEAIGREFGVPPERLNLHHSLQPGPLVIEGPPPRIKGRPQIPNVKNYCFTYVLRLPPPPICESYRQEYDDLVAQLGNLVEQQQWADVAVVAERLAALRGIIDSACVFKERVIRYCVFPDEWFADPLRGYKPFPVDPPPRPY